jgi:PAS domain S-box-containing protein
MGKKRGCKIPPRVRRRSAAPPPSDGERFELAMRAINEGLYDWDIAKGTIYYSDGVRRTTGMTPKDIRTPQDWRNRIHPDDVPKYDTALIAHFKGKTKRFECDYRFRSKDGAWRWARQHGIATRDARGRAVRLTGSTGDISELKRLEQALHDSQERLTLAAQAATEGIYEWNLETGSLFLSDHATTFFAVSGKKLTPAAWNSRIHREDFQGYRKAIGRYFKKQTPIFEQEYRIKNGAGDYAWVVDRAVAVRNSAGRVIRLVGALADITQRKLAEIELRRARDEATEALERQTATAEILRVIASSPSDVKPVFDAIARSALQLIGGRSAVVVRRVGEFLQLAAHTATTESGDEAMKKSFPMRVTGHGFAGRAVLSGKPVEVSDIETDTSYSSEFREMARARGVRSVLSVPMLRDGECIGAINVWRPQPGRFSDHQVNLLKTFADQAVIAIENVRLFNETKEALERQTATAEILRAIASSPSDVQPVFDAIVASALRLMNGLTAHVTRLVGDRLHLAAYSKTDAAGAAALHRLYPLAVAGTVAEYVLATGTALVVPDAEKDPRVSDEVRAATRARGVRSFILTPMMSKGTAIGTIVVNRREAGPFTDHEIQLMATFADQAVIAIENVRLFNETKEALERQTATSEILRAIARSPSDVQPVFETILNNAGRLCNSKMSAIFRFDGKLVHLAATHNWSAEALAEVGRKYPMAPDPSLMSGRAVLSKSVVRVADTHDDSEYNRSSAAAGGWRRMLAVPMLREGEPIGAFVMAWPEPGETSEHHVQLLQTFADQAVIAIENVRLFNETKEALERQTATSEILRVISSSPSDLQPVFEAILDRAIGLCEGNIAVLWRFDGNHLRVAAHKNASAQGLAYLEEHPLVPGRYNPTPRAVLERRIVHELDVFANPEYRPLIPRGSAKGSTQSSTQIAVPLLGEREPLGVITIWRFEKRPFTEKQVALLGTFADQAVIAIENVRLFNETREALERQTATAEILKVIASSPSDVQPVFESIAERAAILSGAKFANVTTFDGELIHLRATYGPGSEEHQRLYPMRPGGDAVSARVVRERGPVQIEDVLQDPEYTPKEAARHTGYRSGFGVPMMQKGRVLGAIALARPEPGAIPDKVIRLLQTFADQAVIAIENVRLFKELQARTDALTKSVGQLTALGEVGQAISSTLDLETVLKTIVSRAVQLTGLDAGGIYEYDECAEQFNLRAAENMSDEIVEMLRSTPIRKGEGAVGGTAVTREPMQVPDTQDESYHSRLREFLIRTGRRALLAVPLLREGHIIGALAVQRSTPGPFAPEVVELLKTFATQSAMAIQNARLFREIAEKSKQLEEASQHKSQFLASMSHELRTPLNAILGFNEMILGQVYGEVPADMREPLADIQASGKHLLRLINNVLDLAKIEAGRMELALQDYSVHDTVESVRSTLRPLAAEKGLEFHATLPDDLPLAYGDSGRIAQCLMNLAGNSLKFTKAGQVEISVEAKDGLLVFKVADTGIGIPPDKIGSLFTEFKQTDATIASEYGGTGLGLSISRKFVEMHGGRIWVESELGKGSAFIFEIPLRAKTP